MKNRKNLKDLQSVYSQKNSDSLISEHDFDFAAGFPPFLRGANVTPTQTKSIQRFTLKFIEVEAQQLELTLNITTKKRIQIRSVSEFIETIEKLPSSSVIQLKYSKYSVLLLAICGVVSENLKRRKISIELHFNSLQYYLEEKKQASTIQKKLAILENSDFYKTSVAIVFSEKGMKKHQLSVEDCLVVNLYSASKCIQQNRNLIPKLELESTSNYFLEIAKVRAARALWSKLLLKLNLPLSATALHILSTETNITNGKNITKKITQSVLNASASFVNETQALELTKNTKITAENIFKYLEEETLINKTTDPWAGSFYVEQLTQKIIEKAWNTISEIENGIIPDSLKELNHVESLKNQLVTEEDFDYSIIKFDTEKTGNAPNNSNKDKLQKSNLNFANSNSILDSAIKAISTGSSINDIKNSLEKIILN
ncbi:methylmalonyl-CoA mutase family protein [Zunongwangia sp.]|uniref:methylmalonyl-CoA mutase family protein n=1 Tax=Zunongwangia sp. TaxID=1965325 RepID=UPI003AA92E5C